MLRVISRDAWLRAPLRRHHMPLDATAAAAAYFDDYVDTRTE